MFLNQYNQNPTAMEAIGIIIGALATIGAVFLQHYLSNRKKRGQKFQLVYVRLMHLKRRHQGSTPEYQAYIKRINKKIDVYDEYQMFNLNVFHKKQKEFKGSYRSSGTVDPFIYFPWQPDIGFPDKGAAKVADFIEYNILNPSDTFITRCVFYNGLQDGEEDIGTRIKYDVDEARLILDFSSLRTEEQLLVTEPKSTLVAKNGIDEKPLGTIKLGECIYMAEIKDGKVGETIRMDLKINWNPIYVFAYGSLINEESAKMAKEDQRIPFQQIEAYLNGYKRNWSSIENIYSEKNKSKITAAFLNIVPDNVTSVNGIIFPVNSKELENLKVRERNYQMIDVTDNIRITSNSIQPTSGTFRVYTFIDKTNEISNHSKKIVVLSNYVNKVRGGCEKFGIDFCNEFEKTTEPHNFPLLEGSYYFLNPEQNNYI